MTKDTPILVALLVLSLASLASAGVPITLGDYVWYDADGNGVQDDGVDAGINGVRVIFYRDYNCNGVIDSGGEINDEIFDYDYTADDVNGYPGYYSVPAIGNRCYIAWLDASTVPAGLFYTTPEIVNVATTDQDGLTVDFGLSDYVPPTDIEYVCPKTIGFWKQQFTAKKSAKYSAAELAAIVDTALALTPVFDSAADFPYYLNLQGNAGPLARALKQFAAVTLNRAAYLVNDEIAFTAGFADETPLNTDLTDATTVGEAADNLEAWLLAGANLGLANELADSLNNGLGMETTCGD